MLTGRRNVARVLRAVAGATALITLVGSTVIAVLSLPALLFAPPFVLVGAVFVLNAFGALAVLAARADGDGDRFSFLTVVLLPNAYIIAAGRVDEDLDPIRLAAGIYVFMVVIAFLSRWAAVPDRRPAHAGAESP